MISDEFIRILRKNSQGKKLSKWLAPRPARRSWLALHETLVFFPSAGYRDPNQQAWVVPVHAWAFREELESLWRNELTRRILARSEEPLDTATQLRFRGRIWPFLVNNLGGRQLVVKPKLQNSRNYVVGRTQNNGHIKGKLIIDDADAAELQGSKLKLKAVLPKAQRRKIKAHCYLVPPTGISVISDIDDTIKITRVNIKSELIANTFYLPFKPITGMAARYRDWAEQGAFFHYVSGTPYQMGPAMLAFFKRHRFPGGSVHLRQVRLWDKSFLNLFADPMDYKLPPVEKLIRQYPQRRFILVGDLGEKDANIYATMARRYPKQIVQIYLRYSAKSQIDNIALQRRLNSVFDGLPKSLWHTFSRGQELPSQLPQNPPQ